jgi:hypothetical protein
MLMLPTFVVKKKMLPTFMLGCWQYIDVEYDLLELTVLR